MKEVLREGRRASHNVTKAQVHDVARKGPGAKCIRVTSVIYPQYISRTGPLVARNRVAILNAWRSSLRE